MKKRKKFFSRPSGGFPVAAVALVLLGLVLWTVASLSERSAAKFRAGSVDTLRVPVFVYVTAPSPSLAGEVVPDSSAMDVVERIFSAGYAAGKAEGRLFSGEGEDNELDGEGEDDIRSEAEVLWRELREGFRDLTDRLLDDGGEEGN